MVFKLLTHEQNMDHKQRIQDAIQGIHIANPGVDEDFLLNMRLRLQSGERDLASPTLMLQDYDIGAATRPDEVYCSAGARAVILSTEHATTHIRANRDTKVRAKKEPEVGTAGLASAVSKDINATHVTMLGRQTGDANRDDEHPFKDRLKSLIDESSTQAVITVHGMLPSLVESIDDKRSFDVAVGVGKDPTPQTAQLGERIVGIAQSLGLRVGLNQSFLKIIKKDEGFAVRVDEEDKIKPVTLAASAPTTTRATIESYARQRGVEIACVQVELSSNLRLVLPEVVRNERIELLGPYMGYHLVKSSAELK